MKIAGVDGCHGGWLCVVDCDGVIEGFVAETIAALLARIGEFAIIAIDIPIGLPERGPRVCDLLARKLLGRPRGSSVFPAPVRAAVAARDYREACDLHEQIDGRRVPAQAWGIFGKIAEVDRVLMTQPAWRQRLCEVHPEVSFACWNGHRPIAEPKKTRAGRLVREGLIESHWPGLRSRLVAGLRDADWTDDDLNDALAALWSAARIATGTAVLLPAAAEYDAIGVPMRISV